MPSISGVIVATVTPFTEGGNHVDLDWIPRHLEYLRENGADAVLITGTNGEGVSLSIQERKQIIDIVLDHRNGLGVMVGTGCSALPDTIESSRYALQSGADAVLIVPPFYFKGISDQGLISYYSAIFDALPPEGRIALYNIPKLSGVEITDALIEALLEKYGPRFLGIKDTSGSIDHTRHYIQAFPQLSVFSGSDMIVEQAIKLGAKGNVSAAANVFPDLLKEIFKAHAQGESAAFIQQKLTTLRSIIDSFPSHSALKYALNHFADLPLAYVRPPLRDLTPREAEELINKLKTVLEEGSELSVRAVGR